MRFLDFHSTESFRADYLKFLCTENQISVNTIVEVGTWKGENAYRFRELFPEAHLYLIDPWVADPTYIKYGKSHSEKEEDFASAYRQTCKLFKNDSHVTILRKPSLEGCHLVPNGLDLVFIDGDHSYSHVKGDILAWEKKVRPGGLLAGHDYSIAFPGVVQAVNECLAGRFIVGRDMVWATTI